MGSPQHQQLVIAVHHVATPTAKVGTPDQRLVRPTDAFQVPFAMILLLDFAKRKATPTGCKCRMVIPSDGESSVSLWDTEDPQGLHEWLNDNLGADCTTTLHEVQEDFTWGLSLDLARMRAADKVADSGLKLTGALGETTSKAAGVLAAGVTTAVGSTQQTLEAFDQRTKVISTAKETTAVIAQKAIGVMSKAAEDRRVQGVVTNVSTGWSKLSNWVGERMRDINLNDGAEEFGHQQPPRGYSPSHEQVHLPSQYAPAYTAQQQQPQQHHAFSTSSGGLNYTTSADQPLSSTKSMLDEPTPAPAVPAAGVTAAGTPAAPPAAAAAAAKPPSIASAVPSTTPTVAATPAAGSGTLAGSQPAGSVLGSTS